jgi:type IV pilus assembly protein PilV
MNKNIQRFSSSHMPHRLANGALPQTRPSRGFTLLEILVAMLVLAIGLLGVAAMQLRGLQYSHDAYLRSQISVLAYDIADRMRLNEANATDYVTGLFMVPAVAPAGCAPTATGVVNDLACWRVQLFGALPPGSSADITLAAGEYTVSLAWDNREGETRTIAYTFMP